MIHSPLLRETQTLHRVVSNSNYRFRITQHGRQEMANDDLIEADVRRVLETGNVTWVEFKKDELWHVEGRDTDGRMIRLVVAVSEKESAVKVVTAMALKA